MLIKTKLWLVELIIKLKKVSFKEATTSEELDLVYSLRYQIYLERGYISANASERLKDAYDDYSANFLIYKKGVPMGTFRLIFDSDLGFWTEAIFNFEKPKVDRDKIAEISRLGIKKEYRGGNIIMFGIILRTFKEVKKRGIKYIYFNTSEKLAERIAAFKVSFFKFEELPLTQENLKNRSLVGGCFTASKINPYMIKLEEAEKSFFNILSRR